MVYPTKLRTHTCGDLRQSDVKKEVLLSGWVDTRRDHGGVIFIDLRDRFGKTQITIHPEQKEVFLIAEKLRREDCIKIKGKVGGVNNKGDRYGIIINEIWYNGKGDSPVNKGDEVEVEYEVNGNFKNVKNITVLKKESIPSIPSIPIKQTPVSMNVSYAKDLFIAMCSNDTLKINEKNIVESTCEELMTKAINLVKQAEKAFTETDETFAGTKVEKTMQVQYA